MGIERRRDDWTAAWSDLPLCRKYLALRIRSSRLFYAATQPVIASWSIGVAEDAWLEIAGPWMSIGLDPVDPQAILRDLQRRGVVHLPNEVAGSSVAQRAPFTSLSQVMASVVSKPRGQGPRLLVELAVCNVNRRVALALARRPSFVSDMHVRLAFDRILSRAQREFNALRDMLPVEPHG